MKINVTFEKESNRIERKKLRIWMHFTHCTHEEFGEWREKNATRLQSMRLSYDIGHMDKVIYFFEA